MTSSLRAQVYRIRIIVPEQVASGSSFIARVVADAAKARVDRLSPDATAASASAVDLRIDLTDLAYHLVLVSEYGPWPDAGTGSLTTFHGNTEPAVTIAFNDLLGAPAASRHGYGLYVGPNVSPTVVSSNIVHEHDESTGDERDWYAPIGTGFGTLDFSCAPDCSSDSPVDLLPAVLVAPELVADPDDLRFCAEKPNSAATLDNGDDGLIEGTHPLLGKDFDDEPRHKGVMDIGADEYWQSDFDRGDANADGTFDISDAVFVLAALFQPGSQPPTCLDAADANDDGTFDISDAIYMLAALFNPGSPPPPPPHMTCGSDPTLDGLGCPVFAPCP